MNPSSNDAFKDLSFMNALDLLTSQQNQMNVSPTFQMEASKSTHSGLKPSKSMEHSSSELLLPTVPSNDSLSKGNFTFTNTAGIISPPMNVPQNPSPNLVNTSWMEEPLKDWRSTVSQQDRIQIVMRLYTFI